MRALVLVISLLLTIVGCQSPQTGQLKPKPLIVGNDVALSSERIARVCTSDTDCAGFKHPCGHLIPVLKWELPEFTKAWAQKHRHTQFDCSRFPKAGAVVCDDGSCANSQVL